MDEVAVRVHADESPPLVEVVGRQHGVRRLHPARTARRPGDGVSYRLASLGLVGIDDRVAVDDVDADHAATVAAMVAAEGTYSRRMARTTKKPARLGSAAIKSRASRGATKDGILNSLAPWLAQ